PSDSTLPPSFFLHPPPPPPLYPLSLHDALPICSSTRTSSTTTPARTRRPTRTIPRAVPPTCSRSPTAPTPTRPTPATRTGWRDRSEEHTSELQSRENLVCRLLLEKKKIKTTTST